MSNKNLTIGLAIAIVIALGGYLFPQVQAALGAATPGSRFPHGITIGDPVALGSAPTNVAKHLVGTCNLATQATSIVATSSAVHTCAATGVRTGDKVNLMLASSSAASWGGFVLGSAQVVASDVISVNLFNYTGTATSSYILATSSVMWWADTTQ